ncbi:MAG: von Willebrand factor type A domain-containing protein [Gemmatimonadota bacterium]|jgi:Ca-activated chloride channel family protein
MIALRFGLVAVLLAVGWPGSQDVSAPLLPEPPDIVLTGRVTDAATGTPLRNAQVSIQGGSRGALANDQGVYVLVLPDGWAGREVTVVVELPGYERATQSTTLSAGTNMLDVTLSPRKSLLDRLFPGRTRPAVEAEEVRMDAAAPGSALLYRVGGLRGAEFNTESYALINENRFLSVASSPLSTFSVDVDRASYANVRRFINEGIRPPVDAVRIEELVNYFPYEDPEPSGAHPLAIRAEVGPAPWQPLHRLVRIGVKARSVDMEDAPLSNLVFLLDVSGSMNSPDKLPLLKTAFRMLVGELRPRDRVAIVVYAGAAGLVLPSTPGSEKEKILEAIGELEAGGSTAGGAGLRLAYKVAAENHIRGGNNRVILATDGDFNVGASSDAEMVRLIEEKRDQGTFLTVLGFGTGNLKDSKMEQIADHGNGNFSYIDNALEAKKVLVSEMGGTLLTVAKDVKIQVEFNPSRVRAYRLIGYENRLLADEDFNDDRKDAGDVGSGHTVTALYEIIPVGVESPAVVTDVDPLRYQEETPPSASSDSPEILFVKLRYKDPDGNTSKLMELPLRDADSRPSADFRFASAVAAWGMLLRDSEYCDGFTLGQVAKLARESLGQDEGGYRREFVRLVETSQSMELLSQESGVR